MKEIIRKSYDRSAANYDNEFTHLQFQKYRLLLGDIVRVISEDDIILDLGCGTGLLSKYLKDNILLKNKVVGLDFSFAMIASAFHRSIESVQADIESLPFKMNSFDIVISVTVLRIIPDNEDDILGEIARVLKPKGLFYLSVLANNSDGSLLTNLNRNGLTVLERLPCGQDTGYRCIKL